MSHPVVTDMDSPWKDALEHFFREAMELYFPKAYEEIDWDRGHVFLDKELQQIRPRGETGRGYVDKLAKVYLKAGPEVWTLAHLEAQGDPEKGFPNRMYRYNYRLVDKHNRPIASFGILADTRARWRPSRYEAKVLGCVASLKFPIVKLLDFRNRREELERSTNPFAVLTLAFLDTVATKKNPRGRLASKLWMARRLRDLGLSREQREELFRLVDWIMVLPEPLQIQFEDTVEQDEEEKMPFVTGFERRGIEKGRKETAADLVIEVLEVRFDSVPEAVAAQVRQIEDPDRLRALHRLALSTGSVAEFAQQLPA